MARETTVNLVRDLARLSENDRTILSAYLNLRDGWKGVEEFVERRSRRLRPLLTKEEIDYFETSLSFLADFLDEKKEAGFAGPGLAFFADLGADFTRGVELTVAPEPLLAVDDQTIIHPLALELDEFEPVGVVMIDAACVRILVVAGEVKEDLNSFCEKIHHRSKKGGWSQMRYQRRRDKEIDHFVKDAVKRSVEIFKDNGIRRVLLAGRDRMVKRLEDDLPREWQDRVIGKVRWDLDSSDDIVEKIRPLVNRAERDQERLLLGRLFSELRRGELALGGIDKVQRALEIDQVDTLILSRSLDQKVIEKLTTVAESCGPDVEFIPEGNEPLDAIGGAGAILRYKIS
ncbi:MAG TPA: hypothetical protein EYP58_05275 [bacterium (Candidatus Stahlbacteria)]|nr:hypothetical protein [Candidatus Stahlbacteria bacterium]